MATSKVYIAIRWKASIPFVLQIFHLLDISEGCNGRTCSRYLTGAAEKKTRVWSSNKELHPTVQAFAHAEDAPWIIQAEHIQIYSNNIRGDQ